ncbi:LLM class F420-dependent oxidoreductase [Actinoplanes sp. NPDC051494]|uniref:LLM class F420-dependent oxidoreductase n=1 Tax=Actinoplanes sp. NPDC051494 TaxID=3363907 RepID=UPI0037B2C05E
MILPEPSGGLTSRETVMKRVRVAAQIAQQNADYAAIRRAATDAEDLGADMVVNWDHFYPLDKTRQGRHFEAWTMLGAWAESTSRAEIGCLVSAVSYRNPDLLADMARTVDHISGGRLVLGIGAGFREWEYEQYGYPFGSPGQRVRETADALERIRARFALLDPPPTRDIPIMMAGGGARMLGHVARYADIWHTFADGPEFTAKAAVLDAHCRELGRDPGEIERSVFVTGGDPAELGPDLLERGVTLFVLVTKGPDFNLTDLRRWVAWRDAVNG